MPVFISLLSGYNICYIMSVKLSSQICGSSDWAHRFGYDELIQGHVICWVTSLEYLARDQMQ